MNLFWRIKQNELPKNINPKVIILCIGVNDLLVGSDARTVAQMINAMVVYLRRSRPNSKILLLGLLPNAEYLILPGIIIISSILISSCVCLCSVVCMCLCVCVCVYLCMSIRGFVCM